MLHLVYLCRMVFHKILRCQLNGRNKTSTKRNTKCPATLDIKIKKLNEATKRNDKFLRRPVPLVAVIKLVKEHNHNTGSAEALKMLRTTPETREAFHAYFESGKTPAKAMEELEKLPSGQVNSPLLLANGAVNPAARTVYYWHKQWRDRTFGPLANPLPMHQWYAVNRMFFYGAKNFGHSIHKSFIAALLALRL